jgi:hypothetical protein
MTTKGEWICGLATRYTVGLDDHDTRCGKLWSDGERSFIKLTMIPTNAKLFGLLHKGIAPEDAPYIEGDLTYNGNFIKGTTEREVLYCGRIFTVNGNTPEQTALYNVILTAIPTPIAITRSLSGLFGHLLSKVLNFLRLHTDIEMDAMAKEKADLEAFLGSDGIIINVTPW